MNRFEEIAAINFDEFFDRGRMLKWVFLPLLTRIC